MSFPPVSAAESSIPPIQRFLLLLFSYPRSTDNSQKLAEISRSPSKVAVNAESTLMPQQLHDNFRNPRRTGYHFTRHFSTKSFVIQSFIIFQSNKATLIASSTLLVVHFERFEELRITELWKVQIFISNLPKSISWILKWISSVRNEGKFLILGFWRTTKFGSIQR